MTHIPRTFRVWDSKILDQGLKGYNGQLIGPPATKFKVSFTGLMRASLYLHHVPSAFYVS